MSTWEDEQKPDEAEGAGEEALEEEDSGLHDAGEPGDEAAGEADEGAAAFGDEEPADEGEMAFGEQEPLPPDLPTTKPCVFCTSEIAFAATRCPHCAGFLPIAEGTIFKQYFWFLFACLAMAIGCLLPWERGQLLSDRVGVPGFDVTGLDSIGGAFLFLLASYGVIASVWNIYHRKMIVWPVILAAIDGAIIGWSRVVAVSGQAGDRLDALFEERTYSEFGKLQVTVKTYAGNYGPGLYLVTIFSTLVILSIVLSVFKGAKEDARRKAEEREVRAAARKTRRG